jgi:hypothetical protein
MLNADALASDPRGLARLRAVLETDPGYPLRRAAALARSPFTPRSVVARPRRPVLVDSRLT